MTSQRVIAHLDMDAFYASVELLRYPELRGQPVVIGGGSRQQPFWENDPTTGEPRRVFARLRDYVGRGVITTATYEARAFGVNSAMGLMKAAKKVPDAILLPTDFDEYRKYSRMFKAAVQSIAPQTEDRGIDEIYIDLTDLVAARVSADNDADRTEAADPQASGVVVVGARDRARIEAGRARCDRTFVFDRAGAEQADCEDRLRARQARWPRDRHRSRDRGATVADAGAAPARRGAEGIGEARAARHCDDRRARTSRSSMACAAFRQGERGVDARCRPRPR